MRRMPPKDAREDPKKIDYFKEEKKKKERKKKRGRNEGMQSMPGKEPADSRRGIAAAVPGEGARGAAAAKPSAGTGSSRGCAPAAPQASRKHFPTTPPLRTIHPQQPSIPRLSFPLK